MGSWSRKRWRRQGHCIWVTCLLFGIGNGVWASFAKSGWQVFVHAATVGVMAVLIGVVMLELRRDTKEPS